MSKGLVLSIILHAVLGLSAIYLAVEKQQSRVEVIQFEIKTPQPSKNFAGNSKGAFPSDTKLAVKKSKGANLNLFGTGYIEDSKFKSAGLDKSKIDFTDHANYIQDSGTFISDSNQQAYFAHVFKKIDEQLMFDSLLAQYGHFGDVYVQFEVDEHGRFVQNGLRVSAKDAILKVHILRAMIKGLTEDFPKEKWNPNGKHQIFQAQFQFTLGNFEHNFEASQKNFGKPVFAFKRTTPEKPIPTNLTDQLLTGGVDYDLFAAAERWQKYNKRKKLQREEFDPFARYKADPLYSL